MNSFDSPRLRRFAERYDRLSDLAERRWLGQRRAALLADLTGTVVEIGAGTGANLPHYRSADRVIATEPSAAMRELLASRLDRATAQVDVIGATADHLPVADRSVDAVVSTLVLCSVDSLADTLAEIRRVLTPTGRLVFLEHIRGGPLRSAVQTACTPLWRHFAAGCHPNRATVQAIRHTGFDVRDLEVFKAWPNFPVTNPMAQGVATLR